MVSISSIKTAVATAIQQSEDVRAFCVQNFGRGALVIVDWFGTQGDPGENEAPFVFVCSANGESERGFVDEETCTVRVVVAGCDTGDAPSRSTTVERTATRNGLVVNGIGAKLETLRDMVQGVIAAASVGAVARSYRREEVSYVEYPLEWAALEVEFYEPQTL